MFNGRWHIRRQLLSRSSVRLLDELELEVVNSDRAPTAKFRGKRAQIKSGATALASLFHDRNCEGEDLCQ
jgi:hypothetical protein